MMRAQIARARATAPVINSLPPVTNANRNLKLTPEYLAGRWEAQDGSRAPVTFTADGKVEYAMFRRQGAWQMATGKYEIKAGQVHVSASSGQAGISMRFKFARGVLYAPKGPSPQVVWKRVGK